MPTFPPTLGPNGELEDDDDEEGSGVGVLVAVGSVVLDAVIAVDVVNCGDRVVVIDRDAVF